MVTTWAEATCTWITVFRFLSRLLTSTLNHQTKPTALFTTAVGLLKGVNMRYCTRVIWHKIHTHRRTHCVRHEQNATLSDCWQTDAVRGCQSLTHGWHQACLNFTVSSEAGWLSLSSRDSNSCLCYLLQELKEGEGDQFMILWLQQAEWARHGPF